MVDPIQDDEELKALQDEQARKNTNIGYIDALNTIATSIAGKQSDMGAEQFRDQNAQKVRDYLLQKQQARKAVEQEQADTAFSHQQQQWDGEKKDSDRLRDPNHPLAVRGRMVLAKLGYPMDDTTTAYDMMKMGVNPITLDMDKRKLDEQVAARKAAREQMAQAKLDAAETTRKQAEDNANEKDSRAMTEALNAARFRAGEQAKRQGRIDAAERAATLVYDDKGNIRNLNPQMVTEAALSLAGMLNNGGIPTDSQLRHLKPASFQGDINGYLQYMSGNPTGADQQEFLKNIAETVKRERDVTLDQLKHSQVQAASGFNRLRSRQPDRFNQILMSAGIDPENDVDPKTFTYRRKMQPFNEHQGPKDNYDSMSEEELQAELSRRK